MAAISLSLLITISVAIFSLSAGSSSGDVHDFLSEYGFPRGLLPGNDKSFSFSNDDGAFSVELESQCYVQFTDLMYYDEKITGKLSYGKFSEISGIGVRKAFIWFDITSMKVVNPNTIDIQHAWLTERLSSSMFDTIRSCSSKLSA